MKKLKTRQQNNKNRLRMPGENKFSRNTIGAGIVAGLFCCLFFLTNPVYSQPPANHAPSDSLKRILPKTSGREKVDLLTEISRSLWFTSLEESMEYASLALKLAQEINYPEGKADALNRMGNVHYFLRNNDHVFEHYNRALTIADSLRDYRRMGVYLNNLGLLYRELNSYDSSAFYLKRALAAKELFGEKYLIASTLNNLGHLYRDMGEYDQSLGYFSRQLEMLGDIGDKANLAVVHRQTAEVLYREGRYDEAVEHLMMALELVSEDGSQATIASLQSLIGRSYLELGKSGEAFEMINASLEYAEASSSKTLMRNNYHLLYRYHNSSGNYMTAYDYLVNYSNLKDSIRTREILEQTVQLEAIFETEARNNRIQLLQMENQIQEMQLTKQKHIKISLAALFALLIGFKIIIVARYRMVQKTNRLLDQKIGELEKTNDKLRKSAIALEQLNATKNRFFSIIAHDLKNPFNALLGFSEIISSSFNELTENEIREYIGILHESSQNLYKLLENLLKWSAARTGKIHFLPENFDLISLIRSEINFFALSAGKKGISIMGQLPDELLINSDKLLLSSVIRNLIDNALKFTNKGGEIIIEARKLYSEVKVEITDTGIGIPYEIQRKLFLIGGDTCRKGTEKEEGGGLGLILCKELMEKAGGKIGVRSAPGGGSTFWLTLPL
jgi:signal transduction histidine kinase